MVQTTHPLGSQPYRHYIVDFHGCEAALLCDPDRIEAAARYACAAAGAKVVGDCIARFVPHGLTVALILAESHLVVSTWPEHGLIMCDFLLCADSLCSDSLLAELRKAYCGTEVPQIRFVERFVG